MRTKTLVATTAVIVLWQFAPFSSLAQRPGQRPAMAVRSTIPLTLVRATNQMVNGANDVRTVTIWTDYTLEPGETFSTLVKRGSSEVRRVPASLFVNWRPGTIRISSAFNWFFGGPLGPGFTEADADAALAQLADNFSDRVTMLTPEQPQELFSVTNEAGMVMTGSIEITRQAAVTGDDVEAVVQLRRVAAMDPTGPAIDYSATIPPGYALLATANTGYANTFTPAGPYQYHSGWFNLPMPRLPSDAAQPMPPTPVKPISPEQMENQRKALQEQLQELEQQGRIAIIPGAPKQIFSITNSSGEIFQGFLELVGPGVRATTPAAAVFRTENPQPAVAGAPQ